MTTSSTPTLLLLTLIVIAVSTLGADIPGTMNYQGRLTDSNGAPVADASYSVIFRIYDVSDSVRWAETQTVTTADGLFSVELGSNGSPMTPDIFDGELRLGITVGAAPELSPRTSLTSVPYAFATSEVEAVGIADEPGVAAYSGAYYVFLNDLDYTVLCSLTVDCPNAGYVMAVAHGRIATLPQHTAGTDSYAIVGISDVPDALPGNQDLDYNVDAAAPSGVYSIPFGMTGMFTVPAKGSYTYYYLAYEYSGLISVADMQFNLIYFPTAYGAVSAVPPPVPVRKDTELPDSDGEMPGRNTP